MKNFELKHSLISEITKIGDKTFSSKTLKKYNKEIKVAEEDIQKGNFYSHNEIKNQIEQWKSNSKIL